MEDKRETIGLTDLLDEVSRDIDELRKKHPSDYGVKNLTMWWELEKERLVVRHGSAGAVKRLRQVQSFKRAMLLFFAGAAIAVAAILIGRLLIP
jgi:hypothetical protein